ncbi:MAG: adenine phosphoribosyltransferase [Treponema sp.]|nr:MAG: adenine phosphoribosyltransferase [Treponema sp.]
MKDSIIDNAVRRVPDFPKPGILFYDVTGILEIPDAFRHCIDRMEELYKAEEIDLIAGLEARGFLFAAPLAERLGLPLALIRKKGKLPGETYSCSYALEYGIDEFEVLKSSIKPNQRVLLVDDLIATGGSLNASRKIFEQGGANVIGCFGVIGLPFLDYEKNLEGLEVKTLINYMHE